MKIISKYKISARTTNTKLALKKILSKLSKYEGEIVELIVLGRPLPEVKNKVYEALYNSYVESCKFTQKEYSYPDEIETEDDFDWDEYLFETKQELDALIDKYWLMYKVDHDEIKLNSRLCEILENETGVIFGNALKKAKAGRGDLNWVIELDGCCCDYCHDCANAEEDPPYHPNCCCVWVGDVYIEDDDGNEVDDIDS